MRGKLLGELMAKNLREPDDIVQILGVQQLPSRESALENRGAQ
jgi:hypothetical protein